MDTELHPRPALIKGVEYPCTESEEQLLDAAYNKGFDDALRMNRAGRIVEDDPLLDLFRERVEKIRKEMIQKGRVEPVNETERGWAR